MTEIKSGLFNRPVTFRGKYKGSSTDDTVDFDKVCAQMECRVSIRWYSGRFLLFLFRG